MLHKVLAFWRGEGSAFLKEKDWVKRSRAPSKSLFTKQMDPRTFKTGTAKESAEVIP